MFFVRMSNKLYIFALLLFLVGQAVINEDKEKNITSYEGMRLAH